MLMSCLSSQYAFIYKVFNYTTNGPYIPSGDLSSRFEG